MVMRFVLLENWIKKTPQYKHNINKCTISQLINGLFYVYVNEYVFMLCVVPQVQDDPEDHKL